jgi:hypothetical protein
LIEQSIAIASRGNCIAFNFVRPFELDRSIANFLRIRIFINRIFSHLYYLSIFIDISHISSITSPSSPWMSTINYLLRRINHFNLFLHTSSEGHFRQSSKSIARSTDSLVFNRRREWISSTFNWKINSFNSSSKYGNISLIIFSLLFLKLSMKQIKRDWSFSLFWWIPLRLSIRLHLYQPRQSFIEAIHQSWSLQVLLQLSSNFLMRFFLCCHHQRAWKLWEFLILDLSLKFFQSSVT